MYAALGYAEESGIPFALGLVRNHYVGRTFIEPKQAIRHFGVKVKLNPVREVVEGKRIVLVDDSIVRGTTSRKIVQMLREAGAREVHVRVSSPPTMNTCHYGIDTPTRERAHRRQPVASRRSGGSSTPTASAISRSRACSRRSGGRSRRPARPASPGIYPVEIEEEEREKEHALDAK